MIKNYFKIAWRNLRRQLTFSLINIVGLAIGLATCILISMYVLDEWSYDRFHAHANRIVRVVFKGTVPGGKLNEAHVMPPVAQALKIEFPEVEETVRIRSGGRPKFVIADKLFYEEDMAFVDPTIFKVFSLPLVEGDSQTALIEPNTVILSESTAEKYFGTTQVVGRSLTVEDDAKTNLTITGVMRDIPSNSHFQFDMLISMASFSGAQSTSWMESEFFTYLLLREGTDFRQMESKLPTIFEKYAGPQVPEAFGMSYTAFRQMGNKIGLYLQPLTDIHLYSDFAYDLGLSGDIRYVYIFGSIAVFMLIIACINFMNLSTAGASKRAKEVGIRKVLGSSRKALVLQFFAESSMLVFISLLLALGLVAAGLPLFNKLSGKAFDVTVFQHFWVFPAILCFGLVIGALAGSYPALFLSSFKPIRVLKGKLFPEKRDVGLRGSLVVFQFFISICLLICTVVVYQQLLYIQQKKLGYDKSQILIIQSWPLGKSEGAFYAKLMQDSRILHATHSHYIPAGPTANNNFFVHSQSAPHEWVKTLRYDVDEHYIPTLGIEMKSGRNFSNTYGTDSLSVILNVTAAKTFGWNEQEALEQTIINKDHQVYRVVGVVKDFHFKSLHESISPLVMIMQKTTGNLLIKVKTEDMTAILNSLKKQYESFRPDFPFTYSFLDDRINDTYQSEIKTAYLLGIFAGLTIFVACLGLFGLAMYTANQRTKEIGIRKVLGASVPNILHLLSKDFIKLVLIALMVATPITWWIMQKWLDGFAYRIEIPWWSFVISGFGAIIIALFTIGFQAMKTAIANPVDSLRNE